MNVERDVKRETLLDRTALIKVTYYSTPFSTLPRRFKTTATRIAGTLGDGDV